MPRRQLQEKMGQSQQFAVFYFSNRCHEQPHPAPNAILAQLKFSSRMLIERLSLAPGFSRVNPVITGIKPVSAGFPCARKPLKRLPDGFWQSSPG
jgi:hypothetical protein